MSVGSTTRSAASHARASPPSPPRTVWQPEGSRHPDVGAIAVAGASVYAAGSSSFQAFDAVSGHATAFAATAAGQVSSLSVSGGKLGVGGTFRLIGSANG